jgi:hypothetical protein
MSINRASLLASGLGLIMSTVAFPSGAVLPVDEPQVVSGYNVFRVFPSRGDQHCVQEFWGGALNSCSTTQSYMIFELGRSIDQGTYRLFTYGQNNGGAANTSFTCQAVAISYNTFTGSWGNVATLTGQSGDGAASVVYVPWGHSLRLQCNNVQAAKGIQSITVSKI